MYTILRKNNSKFTIIDSGKIEDFDYTRYIATIHQVVGTAADLEIFKEQFK